jgi:4'-phosphopantetheinyl transferase
MSPDQTILVSTVAVDTIPGAHWSGIAAQLSDDERTKAQRFVSDADRQAYLAAHCLKRRMLSRADPAIAPSDWRFEQGPHGKPELRGRADLHFNLSHCQGLVACAVRREGPIGIDVEFLGRPAPLEVAARFFSRGEAGWLGKLPEQAQHEPFFRIWTLKEAYIKAVGLGLSQSLGDFSVSVERLDLEFAHAGMGDASGWRFHQATIGASHILAAAWEGDVPKGGIVISQDGLF